MNKAPQGPQFQQEQGVSLLYLPTPELQEGDIVLNSGMRILIDGPAQTYPEPNDPDRTRYAWPGLVTNADALCDRESEEYDSYIACHLRGQWREDQVPLPRQDDWPVVGNSLTRWHVERRST